MAKRSVDQAASAPSPNHKRARTSPDNLFGIDQNSALSNQAPSRTSDPKERGDMSSTMTHHLAQPAELQQQRRDQGSHFQSALDRRSRLSAQLHSDGSGQREKSMSRTAVRAPDDRTNTADASIVSPAKKGSRNHSYQLRHLACSQRVWLNRSDNKIWTITHRSDNKALEPYDERGCAQPPYILTGPLSLVQYNEDSCKILLDRRSGQGFSNIICIEFSSLMQGMAFVEDLVHTYTLKTLTKSIEYLDKVFEKVLRENRSRLRLQEPLNTFLSRPARTVTRSTNSLSSSEANTSGSSILASTSTPRKITPIAGMVERGRPVVKHDDDSSAQPRQTLQPSLRRAPANQTQSLFEENSKIGDVTQVTITLYGGMRKPAFIERLPPLQNVRLPNQPNESFALGFLKEILGNYPRSSGCFAVPPKSRKKPVFPNVSVFKALTPDYDPLLPRSPGQHGAQISCIVPVGNETLRYPFPLFIEHSQGDYRYYGHYRQPRAVDFVSGSEICQVTDRVKQHWARQLGGSNINGLKKPEVRDALMYGWSQKPLGWVLKGGNEILPYDQDHGDDDYVPIHRSITEEEADDINESQVLEALEKADAESGNFRLWYEYLDCVHYDAEFYHRLVDARRVNEHST